MEPEALANPFRDRIAPADEERVFVCPPPGSCPRRRAFSSVPSVPSPPCAVLWPGSAGYSAQSRRRVPGESFVYKSPPHPHGRSEEHTSELQSRENLVCRLLLEKKKKKNNSNMIKNKKKKKKIKNN